jgi:hypothetical protein
MDRRVKGNGGGGSSVGSGWTAGQIAAVALAVIGGAILLFTFVFGIITFVKINNLARHLDTEPFAHQSDDTGLGRLAYLQACAGAIQHMGTYTHRIDRLVAVAGKVNHVNTDPLFIAALDDVMESFCGDGVFRSYINWFAGTLAANFTTVAQLRTNLDTIVSNLLLKNVSWHMITSPVCSPRKSDGEITTTVKAKLYHPTINIGYTFPDPAFSKDAGIYHNELLYVSSSNSWCIRNFVLNETFVELYPDTAVSIINQVPESYD